MLACYTSFMFNRFQKNQRHRWVGGVASGLARFAGFDTFPGRMLVRALFFIFAPVLWWLYLLLWAVMPAQRLYDRDDIAKVVSETVRQTQQPAAKSTVTATAPATAFNSATTGSLKAVLDGLVAHISGKVTPDIAERVLSIRAAILTVEPQLASLRGSRDAYTLDRTAREYLPDALKTYLSLPRQYAETQPLSSGETAHDTLMTQLELLDTTMTRIMNDVYKQDTDALLVHGRFLTEKFGGKTFNLPAQTAATVQPLPEDTGATRVDALRTEDPVKLGDTVKLKA